jgi:hypothetical protein
LDALGEEPAHEVFERGNRRLIVETIVGIFARREDALSAARRLQSSLGFEGKNLIILSPGAAKADVEAIPSEDAEQPGMGKALGGVVGGAAGLGAGALIASLLMPGVGSILAISFGAAVGIGGAAAGAAAGGALEEVWTNGVPKDEVFFYENALRQDRTVLVALSENADQLESGRHVVEASGAEALDAAREKWWIGLRDAERTAYTEPTEFETQEEVFRRGFEAALEPEIRGRSFEKIKDYLQKHYPDDVEDVNFRRGVERGRQYYEKLSRA